MPTSDGMSFQEWLSEGGDFFSKSIERQDGMNRMFAAGPLHDSPTLRTMQKKSETASLVRKLPRRVPLYFCMARSYANFPFTKL